MLENLENYHVLLASKSPRRRELLHMMRLPFTVISMGGINEDYPADMPAHEVPEYLSRLKSDAYAPKLRDNELLITADTVVVADNRILGKPADETQAREMLRALSGKTHQVITGVSVTTPGKRKSFSSVTDVTFATLTDEEIDFYVSTYSPLDKAGAYGIQEWIGCVAVESINGSFYNVMGLPVHRLYQELSDF